MMEMTHGEDEPLSLSYARWLREQGLTLIPLGAPGEEPPGWFVKEHGGDLEEARLAWPKVPRIKWTEFQTRDMTDEEFDGYARRFPGCNWGVLTGKPGGIIILDADAPECQEFLRANVQYTPWTTRTRDDGSRRHFWFLANPDLDIRTNRGKARMDVKGVGGYAVAPGSTHGNGSVYTLEIAEGFGDSLFDLPVISEEDMNRVSQFNLQGASKPSGGTILNFDATKVRPAGAEIEPADDGNRNNTLTSYFGRLYHDQTSYETALRMAREFNANQRPPLPDATVIKTAGSMMRKHNRDNPDKQVPLKDPEPPKAKPLLPKAGSSVARWRNIKVPPRDWIWERWIPRRQTTALYGQGGHGKTLGVQQLETCLVAGLPFLGMPLAARGPVLGIYCEDDEEELARRQNSINTLVGASWDDLKDFHAISRIGEDNLLMTFNNGVGKLTPFWHQLYEMVGDIKPVLVSVDTAADTYGGNENIRGEVRQFIQQGLTKIATDHNCGVLLMAHPSAAGVATGTGSSGSTGWENTVRSRLYLHMEDVTERRILRRRKANYAQRDEEVIFYWHEGGFIPATGLQADAKVNEDADQDFLTLLDRFEDQGNSVSASRNSSNYAPKVFSKYANHVNKYKTKTVEAFETAMHRLLEASVIEVFSDKRNKVTSKVRRKG
jgi:RecA-family ATPase